jgi:hypothetical protein
MYICPKYREKGCAKSDIQVTSITVIYNPLMKLPDLCVALADSPIDL